MGILMKSLFFLVSFLFVFNAFAAAEPTVTIIEGPTEIKLQIRLDYKSRFTKRDVDSILNPENNHIPELFKDPIRLSGGPNKYAVQTSVDAIVMRMDFKCDLFYKALIGATSEHLFNFTNFDRLFRSSVIRIQISESAAGTKVSIVQNAVIKVEPFNEIKKYPFGVKTFKSKIAANIKNFHKNTGGL